MKTIGGLFLLVITFNCSAALTDSIPIIDRTIKAFGGYSDVATLPFSNPAMQPLRQDYSISSVSLGYDSQISSHPMVTSCGRGEQKGYFNAQTYLKPRTSTVWGHASYNNGRILDMQLCESPNYNRVYPYSIADTIGGNQNLERYNFGGGYAHSGDKILWGASISYEAGLYYRQIDPRPKSITGNLYLSLGLAFRIKNYFIGPTYNFTRYRQSTAISFVSEMGETKLFHTTGLGTYYARFEGNGSSVFSDMFANCWGVDLHSLNPHGIFGSIRFSLASLRYVVSDLNKLPMANTSDKNFKLQVGYQSDIADKYWKVYAEVNLFRRHGKENLFGDPTSGSYPQIGKRLAFADNTREYFLGGIAGLKKGIWSATGEIKASLLHELIAYASPHRERLINRINYNVRFSATLSPTDKWLLGIKLSLAMTNPLHSYLRGIEEESSDKVAEKFNKATINDFQNAAAASVNFATELLLQYSLTPHYALALSPSFSFSSLKTGLKTRFYGIALKFLF